MGLGRAPLLSAFALVAAPALAQPHASLDGLWTNVTGTPLERPAEFQSPTLTPQEAAAFRASQARPNPRDVLGQRDSEWYDPAAPMIRIDGRLRSSIIVDPPDGRLPYTAEGRRRLKAFEAAAGADFDGPEARPAPERCLAGAGGSSSVPILPIRYNTNYLIVETPDDVAIWSETAGAARIIRLKAKRHLPPNIRPWMGDSIGHWEGNSLVVETTNFNPGETFHAVMMSKEAKVAERFTRISPREILYDFTVDDPEMFTRPWRGEFVFRATPGPIFEYACHEGNYSLSLVLSGARHVEAGAR